MMAGYHGILKDQPLPGSFVLLELEDLCCCQIWTCLVFCLVVCVFCEHDCVVCEHGCVVCEHGCLASPKHVCVVCYMLVSYEYVIYAEIPVSCELYVYWQWNWKETCGAFRSNHVLQLERDMWTNQSATRGQTWVRHVDKPECETWTIQSATRGQTAARHVDKPECDTWTIQSSTHGQTAARHVALCQRATSSYPCQHAPCHVNSQHGPCHVASPSVTNFMTIWLGHRRNTLLWRKKRWSWKSSTSMTKMTDWSW
jgi:hypothetical protein